MDGEESVLKPCPFCGDKGEIVHRDFKPLGRLYGVYCNGDCGCFLDCRVQTKEEATEVWNLRAA